MTNPEEVFTSCSGGVRLSRQFIASRGIDVALEWDDGKTQAYVDILDDKMHEFGIYPAEFNAVSDCKPQNTCPRVLFLMMMDILAMDTFKEEKQK